MSGEDLLKQYRNVVADLERLEDRMNDYRDWIASPGAVRIGSGSVSGRGTYSDPTGEAVIKLLEAEPKRLDLIGKKWKLQKLIFTSIMQMKDPKCLELIFYRYLKRKTIREISDVMGLTERQLHRIHKTALCELDQVLSDGSQYVPVDDEPGSDT